MSDLRDALVAIYGTDFGLRSAELGSRGHHSTDMTRQAAAYRNFRVLRAGDAATIHPRRRPVLTIGVQDAVNLGWKARPGGQRTIAERLPRYVPRPNCIPVGALALRYTMAAGRARHAR